MQRLLRQAQALRDGIGELAQDPGRAHQQWPRLGPDDRSAVMRRMRQRFGDAFADEFFAIATAGKAQPAVMYWPAGTGPTDEQLLALGYRRGGTEANGTGWFDVEVWVHPAGKVLRRGLSPESVAAPPDLTPTPVTPRQDRALAALEQMQEANEWVDRECSGAPFREVDAEDAMSTFMTARMILQQLRHDLDMNAVDPTFWQRFEQEEDNNALLRKPCCEKNPDNMFFRCPIDQATPRWPRRP